jgi:hypothetical protein
VGSEPRASGFQLFSSFHHFTAEPQRLPSTIVSYDARAVKIYSSTSTLVRFENKNIVFFNVKHSKPTKMPVL